MSYKREMLSCSSGASRGHWAGGGQLHLPLRGDLPRAAAHLVHQASVQLDPSEPNLSEGDGAAALWDQQHTDTVRQRHCSDLQHQHSPWQEERGVVSTQYVESALWNWTFACFTYCCIFISAPTDNLHFISMLILNLYFVCFFVCWTDFH